MSSITVNNTNRTITIDRSGVINVYSLENITISYEPHNPILPSQVITYVPLVLAAFIQPFTDIVAEIEGNLNSSLIIKHNDRTMPNPTRVVFELNYLTKENLDEVDSGDYGATTIREIATIILADIANTVQYKSYTAMLSQSATAAPTALVLEDTIGITGIARNDVGEYRLNSANKFIEDNLFIPNNAIYKTMDGSTINITFISTSALLIQTYNSSDVLADDILARTMIEIRVYN